MATVSLVSKKNLPDKAKIALQINAKKLGYSSIGQVTYEKIEDSGDGKVHQFTAECL